MAARGVDARSSSDSTIILVEDDQSVREMLCAVLVAEGHQVMSYPDGEQATATVLGSAGLGW